MKTVTYKNKKTQRQFEGVRETNELLLNNPNLPNEPRKLRKDIENGEYITFDDIKTNIKITEIIQEFRKEIKQLYRRRLKNIILYGSYARRQATNDSDIDIVVILKGDIVQGKEIDRMNDIITNINLKYGVLISVYPISEDKFEQVNSPLLLNVRKEGIVV